MATTALYRISSNEVVKVSLTGQTFADRDAIYWGVLNIPILTDGSVVQPFRVLGSAKFAVVGSNTVRNATQAEIDTFASLEQTDANNQDSSEAINFFQTHPRFRKAFKAFAQLTIDEINILRGQIIGAATLVWDAPNMANASGATSPNISVTGAAFGDFVEVAASISFAGLIAFGYVSAANTVVIRLHNGTGGAINPGSATYNVAVRRDVALAARTKVQALTALTAAVSAND